jgi:N-hydroxyarylamine O-acetyltransferase
MGRRDQPTFETLAGLLHAHMLRIQFENLDVLLGRPVRLDLDSLQDKLVRARRGGYCFEHATLFAAVLEKLGFQPVRHAARVVCSPRVRKRPARTCS